MTFDIDAALILATLLLGLWFSYCLSRKIERLKKRLDSIDATCQMELTTMNGQKIKVPGIVINDH